MIKQNFQLLDGSRLDSDNNSIAEELEMNVENVFTIEKCACVCKCVPMCELCNMHSTVQIYWVNYIFLRL